MRAYVSSGLESRGVLSLYYSWERLMLYCDMLAGKLSDTPEKGG